MDKLSYHRHRFPSIVIQQAVWLYFHFGLSYRDVEDIIARQFKNLDRAPQTWQADPSQIATADTAA